MYCSVLYNYRSSELSPPILQASCRSFVSFPAQQWPLMVQRPFTSLVLVTIMKQRGEEDRKTLPHLREFMIELIFSSYAERGGSPSNYDNV